MSATITHLADDVGDFCLAVLRIAGWVGLVVVVLIGGPLALLMLAHRHRARHTEAVLMAATRVGWAPLRGAATICRRAAGWCDAARDRSAHIASHGHDRAWMAVLCPLGTAVLAFAIYKGWQTEQATLKLALDPGVATAGPVAGSAAGTTNINTALAPVRDWMTYAIFACGWVGGWLLLEAVGVTHFLPRHENPTRSGVDAPRSVDRSPGAETAADSRTQRVRAALASYRLGGIASRGALGLVALLFLAVPVYALGTAAASRADSTVEAKRVALARHGADCDVATGAVQAVPAAPGLSAYTEARAVSECARLTEQRTLTHRWGLATAGGMALLDVVLGWLAVLTIMWALAALAGLGSLTARGAAGVASAAANTLDRSLTLVRTVLRGDDEPTADERSGIGNGAPLDTPPVRDPSPPEGPPPSDPTIDLRDDPAGPPPPVAPAPGTWSTPPPPSTVYEPWAA